MKYQIMVGVAAVGLIAGCATHEDGDRMSAKTDRSFAEPHSYGTRFNELPAAVQRTIRIQAPNTTIDDFNKETRADQVVYEIQFADAGKNPKIYVAEDGTLMKSEDGTLGTADGSAKSQSAIAEGAGASGPSLGTKLSDLPDAVQKAIKSRSPNAKIDDIDKETRSGRVIYEIQFEEPGQNPKLHIAEDGTLVDGE